MNFEGIGRYVAARVTEPSTWRGLVLVLTAVGAQISPEQGEAIIAIGLFGAGLIGAGLPDPKDKP